MPVDVRDLGFSLLVWNGTLVKSAALEVDSIPESSLPQRPCSFRAKLLQLRKSWSQRLP